jgi:putative radical SAM enzyme (TIGR03279 family)
MHGLIIESITPRSQLAELGVHPGDRLLSIDDLVPRDVIDVQLELAAARTLVVQRSDGHRLTVKGTFAFDATSLTLTDPIPGGVRECNNHCEFCFIRGLPGGLRPSLYVFDDDYRYSFLWGNFLTLTNLEEADWARIGYQRLSPLNVSVHATDDSVRRGLLNNRHAPPILPQLRRLAEMGIEVNTQIVLCAGLNDGQVLDGSIEELAELHPSVRSLSVVPVGLTSFSRVKNIRRPTPEQAATAIGQLEDWQVRLRRRLNVGLAYGSDELYLLAGRTSPPPAESYDGFPVLSNGVGLLRSMLDEWQHLLSRQRTPAPAEKRMAWLTGPLAAPALERMACAWETYAGWRPIVRVVHNHLFGDQVSVSGLLSGADLIRSLSALPTDLEDVVLPRGAFGFDGRCTLDGISAADVGAAHSGRVHLASTSRELLEILTR